MWHEEGPRLISDTRSCCLFLTRTREACSGRDYGSRHSPWPSRPRCGNGNHAALPNHHELTPSPRRLCQCHMRALHLCSTAGSRWWVRANSPNTLYTHSKPQAQWHVINQQATPWSQNDADSTKREKRLVISKLHRKQILDSKQCLFA